MTLADAIQAKLDAGYPLSSVETMYGRISDPSVFRRKHRASYSPPAPPPPPPIVFSGERIETPRDQKMAFIAEIAEAEGLTLADMTGPSQARRVSNVRAKAMWSVKDRWPDISYPALSKLFNRENHTTAMHAVRCHQAALEGRVYRKTWKVPK